jgi:hypothetical protein
MKGEEGVRDELEKGKDLGLLPFCQTSELSK